MHPRLDCALPAGMSLHPAPRANTWGQQRDFAGWKLTQMHNPAWGSNGMTLGGTSAHGPFLEKGPEGRWEGADTQHLQG